MEKVSQSEQYISLMVFLIRADGIVDDDERNGLLNLLADRLETPLTPAQVGELQERLDAPGPTTASDEQLLEAGRGIDPLTLCHLVRDAYSLAASDGEIHRSEVSTIRRYLRLAGIPLERFADVDMWARFSRDNLDLGQKLLTPSTPG